MALPVIGMTAGGVILTALTTFFATKIPVVLAALGLSYGVMSGLDVLSDTVIQHIQTITSGAGEVTIGGETVDAIGLAGQAGLFAVINIVLSGFVGLVTLRTGRVVLRAITS